MQYGLSGSTKNPKTLNKDNRRLILKFLGKRALDNYHQCDSHLEVDLERLIGILNALELYEPIGSIFPLSAPPSSTDGVLGNKDANTQL